MAEFIFLRGKLFGLINFIFYIINGPYKDKIFIEESSLVIFNICAYKFHKTNVDISFKSILLNGRKK